MVEVIETVYLTGFMGAGKSAVGAALARRLRRPFVDLDAAIEREAGAPVARLFAERGEREFRRLERRALIFAAGRVGSVVALGGGALLDERNRALVERTGTLVRLDCARAELIRRLNPSRARRPLLAGGALAARVARLQSARRGAYGRADMRVSTTKATPAAVAAEIARRLS